MLKSLLPRRRVLKLLALLAALAPIFLSAYYAHNPIQRPPVVTTPFSIQESISRDYLEIRFDKDVYQTSDREIVFYVHNYKDTSVYYDYPELQVQVDGVWYRLQRRKYDQRFIWYTDTDALCTSACSFPIDLYCDALLPARYRLAMFMGGPLDIQGDAVMAEFEVIEG